MRKALATLVRVRSWHLQEARRKLGAAERARAALEDQARALSLEIAAEQACARSAPIEAGSTYAAYAAAASERRKRLDAARARAEDEERALRADLEAAFGELKRVELFAERCAERDAAEAKARDGARLDEIAVGGFRRRTPDDGA